MPISANARAQNISTGSVHFPADGDFCSLYGRQCCRGSACSFLAVSGARSVTAGPARCYNHGEVVFSPLGKILQALRGGVTSFKDHDYSATIVDTRDDELGLLVQAYNDLAKTLRAERFAIFQRELLLDTVIQSSAVAVLIVNQGGAIVYSNREAVGTFPRARRREALTGGC